MPSKAEIKDRIEKLYALANGGATPGEAKAAITMAEKLMVKYGIKSVNKNRYKNPERSRNCNETPKKPSPPKNDKRSNNDYWQKTIGYTTCIAEKMRETDKALLLNIVLDSGAYPWWTGEVKVSVWMPKSCVKMNKGRIWVVKEDLLYKNLNNNRAWLREHHPVFIGRDVVFKLAMC